MTQQSVLKITALFQHVHGQAVLADVEFTLTVGERLLIIGPNGGGKSLLVRLILGLDVPSAGTLTLFGTPPSRQRGRVGAVLQGGALLAELSVLDNLLLPLRQRGLRAEALARAARLALTRLQLDGLEHHHPRTLSLGQQRRVELARALIHQPELLVWDGVSDGLEPSTVREIVALLHTEQSYRPLTLLMTDNSLTAATQATDRILVLENGRMVFSGTREALINALTQRSALREILRGLSEHD